MTKMVAQFIPVQICFGVPRAGKAAAHAARAYVARIQPGTGLLKLDFKHAFNMVHRNTRFLCVQEATSELYPFIHLCYSSASLHNFDEY